ncbi:MULTISPECIES: gephyrin-like molybdotransferase receptor GlpR [unclassified Streptomyces]|uniref:divisome protein SepX/GlpR n=1 Tax=unclassified Streptomyces TaxID=2593676 RepID=UPI002E28F8AF|nr:gephyrin-like molybdotransferase receptor GlpR [Streptomyces sp. NBC_00228]
MSSSGLIYAVIVGAWAAYLVPMWLRRQDELNEARPTERFSTAIRLLSGRAGMERRYAKDLRARSAEEGEPSADASDAVTDSVDVRAFAMPPVRPQVHAPVRQQSHERPEAPREPERGAVRESERAAAREAARESEHAPPVREPAREQAPKSAPQQAPASAKAPKSPSASARKRVPVARRSPAEEAAAARARRVKVLARRRRTTVMLFLAFTLGAIVAAVGGLALLWAPGVPAVLLSGYIAYLRTQERRRFAYQMDRRRAEVAAQRLRERQPRRRASVDASLDDAEEGPEPETDPGLSALAADRRALVEQTDHAEWVDQQRERQRRPGQGDSWDPVPVPLPTYVTAPVAPRATSDVDLGAPDAWSSARSSSVAPEQEAQSGARDDRDAPHAHDVQDEDAEDGSEDRTTADGRTDARRAASARRARERGRTPLFDQYEDGERPRAANE